MSSNGYAGLWRFLGVVPEGTPFFRVRAGLSLSILSLAYLCQLYFMMVEGSLFLLLPIPALLLWLAGYKVVDYLLKTIARFERGRNLDAEMGEKAQFAAGMVLGVLVLPLTPLLLLVAVLLNVACSF